MPSVADVSSDSAESISLSPAAQAVWESDLDFEGFVLRLLEKRLNSDAVRVIGAAMAPQDLAWWSALCIWATRRESLTAFEDDALRSAVYWIFTPTQEWHQRASAAMKRCLPDSAAYALAASVGSFGFADCPGDPPSPANYAMGQRAALASILTSIATAPHADIQRYLTYFGLSLMKSPGHWKNSSP